MSNENLLNGLKSLVGLSKETALELVKAAEGETQYRYAEAIVRNNGFVDKADELGAKVIAARVVDLHDYYVFKPWLEENENNRLILFHSASYPYGFKMLTEYPDQVTFGDVNLVFS